MLLEMKNNDSESRALKYEIDRMQKLDRLKVKHAKDLFVTDSGVLLPSIDYAYASTSASRGRYDISKSMTNGSLLSEKQIVSTRELDGQCDRLHGNPSNRSRLIIAHSQEPTA